MALSQEGVKFSDFVKGLTAATESDLAAGNNMPIVTASSVKKMGGENVAKESKVESSFSLIEQRTVVDYYYENQIEPESEHSGYRGYIYGGKARLTSDSGKTARIYKVEKGKKYKISATQGSVSTNLNETYNPILILTDNKLENVSSTGNVYALDNLGQTESGKMLTISNAVYTASMNGYIVLNYQSEQSVFVGSEITVKDGLNSLNNEVNSLNESVFSDTDLVLEKGKFFSIESIVNTWSNQATIESGCCDIYGNKTWVLTQKNNTRIKIETPNHEAGKSLGFFFYLDSAYLQKNKNEDPISVLDILSITFYNANYVSLGSMSIYKTAINNGWNYVQYKPIEQKCSFIYIQCNGDSNTLEWILGSYVVGRRTKPVIAISYDGGPNEKTYNSGIYALHRSLKIPFTISGTSTYNVSSDASDYVKKLTREHLVEWAPYTGTVNSASDYSSAKTAAEIELKAFKDCANSSDLISVCCSTNKNTVLCENVMTDFGFKIFRCLGHNQNILMPLVGLRTINVFSMGYVHSGWTSSDDESEITRIKGYIDYLIEYGQWGSIMSHAVVSRDSITSSDYGLSETAEVWQEILQYISNKVSEGKILVMKIGDIWRYGNETL